MTPPGRTFWSMILDRAILFCLICFYVGTYQFPWIFTLDTTPQQSKFHFRALASLKTLICWSKAWWSFLRILSSKLWCFARWVRRSIALLVFSSFLLRPCNALQWDAHGVRKPSSFPTYWRSWMHGLSNLCSFPLFFRVPKHYILVRIGAWEKHESREAIFGEPCHGRRAFMSMEKHCGGWQWPG